MSWWASGVCIASIDYKTNYCMLWGNNLKSLSGMFRFKSCCAAIHTATPNLYTATHITPILLLQHCSYSSWMAASGAIRTNTTFNELNIIFEYEHNYIRIYKYIRDFNAAIDTNLTFIHLLLIRLILQNTNYNPISLLEFPPSVN